MKRLLRIVSLFVLAAALFSCDKIHEFPQKSKEIDPTFLLTTVKMKCKVILNISQTIQTKASATEEPDSLNLFDRRFIIEVYNNEDFDKTLDTTITLVRPARDTSDLDITTSLRARHYKLAVWMDFVKKDNPSDLYYSTSKGLANIHLPSSTNYSAGSDFKDCQTFLEDLDLTPYVGQWFAEVTVKAELSRPVAKIRLLANDLEKYLEDAGIKKTAQDFAKEVKVEIRYKGYLPTGFNAVTGRLNDSQTGFGFKHGALYPEKWEQSNCTLVGSDYVFVNGESSSVTISAILKDKNGNVINETENITIPIVKGKETVVIYKFFTKEYEPGIGIDPGFDGEFVVNV